MWNPVNVDVLLGQVCADIKVDSDEIIFTLENGDKYKMYHDQDCCESVMIEDIAGDVQDLIGSPLTMAEEAVSDKDGPLSEYDESYTWTFYRFATVKGYVTIRWYGTSNGYYSESVVLNKM